MSKCPECKGEMKPLFSGEFCPNDCDKPAVKEIQADALTKFQVLVDALSKSVVYPFHYWYGQAPNYANIMKTPTKASKSRKWVNIFNPDNLPGVEA